MTEPRLPLPDDHDCEACACGPMAEGGIHVSASGLCLSCGGCWDPACCQHDECMYAPREVTPA